MSASYRRAAAAQLRFLADVRAARAVGVSLRDIGDALGMTPPAVLKHERKAEAVAAARRTPEVVAR